VPRCPLTADCSRLDKTLVKARAHRRRDAGTRDAARECDGRYALVPVPVLAMGTALAHMLRADAAATRPDAGTSGPVTSRSPARSREDQDGSRPDQTTDQGTRAASYAAASATGEVDVRRTTLEDV
jgi:hypothetical protein